MPSRTLSSSIVLLAGLTVWSGCQSTYSARVPTRAPAVSRGPSTTPASTRPPAVLERPVAMLDNEPITISSMKARMLEQSGAETLRELRLETSDPVVLSVEHRRRKS